MKSDAAIAYCRDLVAAPGSDLYYATLFASPPEKARLYSLHAFAAELARIPRAASDPGVARVKLAWWQEDVARIRRGPEHPVTTALIHTGVHEALEPRVFDQLADAVEQLLNRAALPDMDAVIDAHRRFEGTLWRATARLLGSSDAETLGSAEVLGCALGLSDTLRRLHEQLTAGVARLPTRDLANNGLTLETLLAQPQHTGISGIATLITGHARKLVLEGLHGLPHGQPLAQLPFLIMVEIAVKTLAEIQIDGFRLLERHTALTPLRKLWIAIKIRHREQRLHRRLNRL